MVVRPFLNSSHSMHTNLIDPLTCTPRTTSICSRNWPVFVACFSSVFVGFRRPYLCIESEFHLSRLTRESLQAEEEVYQGADVPGRQERAGPHHHHLDQHHHHHHHDASHRRSRRQHLTRTGRRSPQPASTCLDRCLVAAAGWSHPPPYHSPPSPSPPYYSPP